MKIPENYKDIINKIKEQITNENYKEVEREIHTLKGVSGNIGADTTHNLSKEVETAFKANRDIINLKSFKDLKISIKSDISDINKLLGSVTQIEDSEVIYSKEETLKHLTILLKQIEDYEIECENTLESILVSLKHFEIESTEILKIKLNTYDYDESYKLCKKMISSFKKKYPD